MNILRLLWTGSFVGATNEILVTLLAGLGNTVLIGLVNMAAERAAFGRPIGLRLVLLYVLGFAIFYAAERSSLRAANALLQTRLAALNLRLADKVRTAELRTIERLGRGRLLATIGQETSHLARTFPLLASAAQSLVLLAFCLIYIALLSWASFVVVSGVTALGLALFTLRRARLRREMVQVHAQEAAMLDMVAHVTDGFQEIRLNADRNDALYRQATEAADRLQTTVAGIGRDWAGLLMFSNAYLYALLGVVVFVLPGFFAGYTDVIYKIAAIAFFSVGPILAVTSSAPLFDRANIGLGHVFALEQALESGPAEPPAAAPQFEDFQNISLQAVEFEFGQARDGFHVGPLDISLRRGELVFLTGGNGSGKSTTLKLLCGLYEPSAGRVCVGDVTVTPDTLQAYRETFSCVFTDFHLFPRAYGVEHADLAQVNALLRRMDIADKVTFADGAFSTQALSTGQRKRLALVVALLEDRPILLLDEFAADQDAEHRAMFYNELLPELKREGKTVVAVTHDDRYWAVADRRIQLDLGRMAPELLALPAPA
jgi:putative ATP-binding cassette transporter